MGAQPALREMSRWDQLRFLLHLPRLVKLYWRLLMDRRVALWPKLMLAAAVAYVVFPMDLLPDVLPFVGEIDDLVVFLAAARWFIGWCPPAVVQEHVAALSAPPRA